MTRKIIFLLLLNGFIFSNAQTKKTDEPETQSRIRVFSPQSAKVKTEDSSYKWCVKTDVFSILTGEFPIIGEYRIGKKFSVEASAGITYEAVDGFSLLNIDDLTNINGNNGSYLDSQSSELGSAFRASFKYFPSSDYDALEGWYFGVQLMTKTINRGYDNTIGPLTSEKDKLTKSGASLIVGKQLFADSNIVWDLFFGAGLASIERSFLISTYDSNTQTNKITAAQNSKRAPNFLLGLRIGFGN